MDPIAIISLIILIFLMFITFSSLIVSDIDVHKEVKELRREVRAIRKILEQD